MNYIIFPDKRGYRTDNETKPLSGDTLTVQIGQAETEGTLIVNGKALYVHRGLCAVPTNLLCEGENTLIYQAHDSVSHTLESIFMENAVICPPKPLPRSTLTELFMMCQSQKKSIVGLDARIRELEKMCFPSSLI